ncbi:protein NRT1/ PTR FAMILY 5.5 [Malus sylvestris]|uniref:protein NRT1/ PTR FAMILY 5.5 n=1 Tax=Malus sylvestris TaxID=3752 RepID=UPI0021ACDB2D|nr:protein NRT1/ PTR FAMILY 5.5 [Malus sylvestris]
MWADILAAYAMWMTMAYLTDVWKLSPTHAAGILNIFWGMVAIMPVGLPFLVDAFMGNFWMVLVSSFSYCVGLGFLSMSTPPVLTGATGTCSAYEPECIGQAQKAIFFTALALIAVGVCGHLTSLRRFIAEQFMRPDEDADSDLEEGRLLQFFLSCLASVMAILVPIAGVFAAYFIRPWSIRYGIPAICTLVALLIFLTGSRSYHTPRGQGTTLIRVFVASASKIFQKCPRDASQLYERHDVDYCIPHTNHLRCLDKAAILSATQPLEQQQNNRWRLCRVTEVEETKSILCLIPLCTTFILLGVVTSIGNTYFIEQAIHMNRKVGRIKVPLPLLLWFYDQAKQFCGKLTQLLVEYQRLTRYGPPIGIGVSMIFAILCCITAAKVETRRLGVVASHENSIALFFINQVPPSMARYMVMFAIAVFGAGTMGSTLSVYLVGKISGRGGRSSWFQDTLNKSRLDNYYWTLAALAAANLVFYILMSFWYAYNDSKSEEEEDSGATECLTWYQAC